MRSDRVLGRVKAGKDGDLRAVRVRGRETGTIMSFTVGTGGTISFL